MTRIFVLSVLYLLTCCGCQQLVLGDDAVNDPENNYEIFWRDFDAHYGLFGVRGWDWDSIYTVTQPQVTLQTSDEDLYEIFRSMVEYLDDTHTFIYWPDRAFFAGNRAGNEEVETEFSAQLIVDEFLNVIDSSQEESYVYGQLRDRNIGYLYLDNIDNEDLDFGDQLLVDLGHNEALIIDIRNNGGGSDRVGAALAGRFADREELAYTVQERNGPQWDDFAEKTSYFLKPLGSQQYLKPVVILTDQITVSAAEVMLSYFKLLPRVTQIGTTTSGDFSDTGMRRFLPNGMQYQYSIMKFLQPDGSSLDGVGHVPDIYVRNTVGEIEAGQDRVLERSFEFLFDEYGIE